MLRTTLHAAIILGLLAAFSCGPAGQKKTQEGTKVRKEPFGKTADGTAVDLYTLQNKNGAEVKLPPFGGIVESLKVPDRAGKFDDVVLGFDSLDGYLGTHPYFGALVGRYGNRIAKGRFTLNGVEYKLACNDGANTLHGGIKGFDKAVWAAREITVGGSPALELTYVSKDGEEGYPGNLTTTVTYSLSDKNELRIEYRATTDKDTVLNLTNHTYFNLAGQGQGDILSHVMMIRAGRFTPVDAGLIPTGELRGVEGTPLDFRTPTAIGARIEAKDEQMVRGKGYDHNFVLDGPAGSLSLAAKVTEPKSGRVMEVLTTQPGVQFYTGNFLDGTLRGKGGKAYAHRFGFCLETQHFPDSPNQSAFPSAVLKPGSEYRETTVYRFSVEPAK